MEVKRRYLLVKRRYLKRRYLKLRYLANNNVEMKVALPDYNIVDFCDLSKPTLFIFLRSLKTHPIYNYK